MARLALVVVARLRVVVLEDFLVVLFLAAAFWVVLFLLGAFLAVAAFFVVALVAVFLRVVVVRVFFFVVKVRASSVPTGVVSALDEDADTCNSFGWGTRMDVASNG